MGLLSCSTQMFVGRLWQEEFVPLFRSQLSVHDLLEPQQNFFVGHGFFVVEYRSHKVSSADHQIAQETDAQNGARRRDVYETLGVYHGEPAKARWRTQSFWYVRRQIVNSA